MSTKLLLVGLVVIVSTGCNQGDAESGAGGAGAGTGAGGAIGAGGGGAVGAPCTTADECPAGGSGSPACLSQWPDGYCAVVDCAQHGHDCPGDPGLGGVATTGSQCVLAPTAMCLALCGDNSGCRDGYECVEKSDAAGHGSGKVCFPLASGGGGMNAGGAGGGMMGGGGM
ncbi:MAG: hypothetical protein IT373_00725 [Polyangiaceae bacterium]|nr:hypothetical protein [Polyangiaceae bacterium]